MTIEDLLRNPALKRALSAGEERMGKLVGQLLSSERVVQGAKTVFASAQTARSALDRGLRGALQAVNLPTTADVEELRRKLAELESMLDGLADRLDGPEGKGPQDPGRAAGRAAGRPHPEDPGSPA